MSHCPLLKSDVKPPHSRYFDGFIYNLKYFLEKHGEEGKAELNSVCPTHIVTLIPSAKFTYNGVDVEDGKLRLLFHPNYLATNIGNVGQLLAEALSSAPQPDGASPLSFAARHSIKTEYAAEIPALLGKARTALQNPDFDFEPGFEELAAQLKKGKDVREDWETNLGGFAKAYFESFLDVLASEKFGEDEMLREGLAEGAPKGVVKLRIVEALATSQTGYNEIVLDDGALVIQVSCPPPCRGGITLMESRPRLHIGGQISIMLHPKWWISCKLPLSRTAQLSSLENDDLVWV